MVRKEEWYKPDIFLYREMLDTLGKNKLIEVSYLCLKPQTSSYEAFMSSTSLPMRLSAFNNELDLLSDFLASYSCSYLRLASWYILLPASFRFGHRLFPYIRGMWAPK